MSLALYRKYRPGSFADVIGQEHVTEPLQQALRTGRIHHAYLFSGPRGCGKTSSARILARSLNCVDGPTPTPCGHCDSCIALAPGGPGHLDVIEIDAASHGLVDDARDLRERAFFSPVSSRYKVYVIDEAHMVSTAGFNALLKLVEEPPDFLVFVFATTEPDKVLTTIRSRTFHYPFRLVPPRSLQGLLADICAREGVAVEPLVLPLVVRAGAGSVRDALSVLDQLIAGVGPQGLTYDAAVRLLGFTDAALLDEVVDDFAASDGAAVFAAIDQVVEAGYDPRRFATDLLERLRDLVILAAVPDAGAKGLLAGPADQLARMQAQADRLGPPALSRAADIVYAGLAEMRGATSPRLLLELICARVLLPGATRDESALWQRLDRLERRLAISDASPTPPPAPPPASPPVSLPPASMAPVPATPAPVASPAESTGPVEVSSPAGQLDAAAVRRVWPELLEAVKGRRRTVHALVSNAQVVGLDGDTLTLAFDTPGLVRTFSANPLNVDKLREALAEVLGVDWQVRPTVSGMAGGAAVPAPAGAPPRAAVDGFAPGDDPTDDEPADEADPGLNPGPPVSGEDAAVALLREGLGARVIGRVDPDAVGRLAPPALPPPPGAS